AALLVRLALATVAAGLVPRGGHGARGVERVVARLGAAPTGAALGSRLRVLGLEVDLAEDLGALAVLAARGHVRHADLLHAAVALAGLARGRVGSAARCGGVALGHLLLGIAVRRLATEGERDGLLGAGVLGRAH